MPHKYNADRRHHIPKMAFKVQNWAAYEAGLRRRGSLTLWIEDSARQSDEELRHGFTRKALASRNTVSPFESDC